MYATRVLTQQLVYLVCMSAAIPIGCYKPRPAWRCGRSILPVRTRTVPSHETKALSTHKRTHSAWKHSETSLKKYEWFYTAWQGDKNYTNKINLASSHSLCSDDSPCAPVIWYTEWLGNSPCKLAGKEKHCRYTDTYQVHSEWYLWIPIDITQWVISMDTNFDTTQVLWSSKHS